MENTPRSMYFKVDFINFFRRTLRFCAILSDRFDHILISEKIDIFDENFEKGRFRFGHISMKAESPIKVWGLKAYLSDRPRRWVGKQAKKIISKGPILLYKNALFWVFLKISKTGDFDLQISLWKQCLQKKGVYHDEGNIKSKKSVISDFWFSNFRHRDFSI